MVVAAKTKLLCQLRRSHRASCASIASTLLSDGVFGISSRLERNDIEMTGNRTQVTRRLTFGLLLCLALVASLTTASQAEIGSVRVVFTKAGFILGVGGGRGILTFRGYQYPFHVSGLSMGFTVGASTNRLVGRALNMRTPGDIAGTYAAIGAGGALAAGAGGVQLQNAQGVILQLRGVKVGVELSASVGGVTITME
jgi:hypothetical protein